MSHTQMNQCYVDTLSPQSILVTIEDVGRLGGKLSEGLGMWVNYILGVRQQRAADGSTSSDYQIKSIPKKLPISVFLKYLRDNAIQLIVPTGVHDAEYLATHRQGIEALGVRFLACSDPSLYTTLDHKWLSYRWIVDSGLEQSTSLPLKEDTLAACRQLAESTFPKPVFIKKTCDTHAGAGVTKVANIQEYEAAVKNKAVPASSSDCEVMYMVQQGNSGLILGSQSSFYNGELVSTYISCAPGIADYGNLKGNFVLGPLNGKDVRTEVSVENRDHVASLVQMLQRIGRASNYTGMMDVEFFMPEEPSASVSILEFNPRFSGAVHSSLTSGFLEDYLDLLYQQLAPARPFASERSWPLIRSDGHEPDSWLRDYNLVKFYASRPGIVKDLQHLRIMKVLDRGSKVTEVGRNPLTALKAAHQTFLHRQR